SKDGTDCACVLLKRFSKDSLFMDDDTQYMDERTAYWSATDWLSPRCIFIPDGAGDVAKGVAVLRECGAEFAVKGGGHMPLSGTSSSDDGVLISLKKFRQLVLCYDKNSPEVGPGLWWKHVYNYLLPHNRFAVGGRVASVGVPGYLLGGCISFLASKWGFGMDHVEDIVRASPTSHPELFWALKGGSSNFGIVTSFKL
ncbi:hypothetical protein BDZ91DRAFT_633580, partial [Kalaharituber pfeilii]